MNSKMVCHSFFVFSIAGEATLKSAADGHTLIDYGNALWILPMLRKSVPYDTVREPLRLRT